MALQINKITGYGITLPSAYARVVSFSGDTNKIIINVVMHANSTARANGDKEIDSNVFVVAAPDAIATGGIIHWCYNQLKVLPEFTGYIDV